jgi:hypothetical protein
MAAGARDSLYRRSLPAVRGELPPQRLCRHFLDAGISRTWWDEYSEFKRSLRTCAVAHPGAFRQREVTDDSRESIFGRRVSRAAARGFFKQAIADDVLHVVGKQRGGGESYEIGPQAPASN